MADLAVNKRTGIVSLLVNFALIAFLLGLWLISSVVVIANIESGPANDAHAVFLFACTGVYFSRWGIAAFLIVLLPGSFSVRVLIAILVFGVEAMATAMFSPNGSEPILVFLLIPMILVAICLPFEVARVVWNLRLDVDWFDFIERRQLGIKSMLAWITAAAIVFSLVRLTETERALAFFGSGIGISFVAAVLVLPFTLKVMQGRRRLIRFFVILIVLVLIATGISFLIEKFSSPLSGLEKAVFPVTLTTFLTAYGLGLFVLQRMGMRLESG